MESGRETQTFKRNVFFLKVCGLTSLLRKQYRTATIKPWNTFLSDIKIVVWALNKEFHTNETCCRYLKGPESKFKENFNVVQVCVWRLYCVDKHHIVDSKERDEEEGGLSQTSAHTHTHIHTQRQEHEWNVYAESYLEEDAGVQVFYLNWDCSFPPTSAHRSFCTRIRMMLMNKMKLIL